MLILKLGGKQPQTLDSPKQIIKNDETIEGKDVKKYDIDELFIDGDVKERIRNLRFKNKIVKNDVSLLERKKIDKAEKHVLMDNDGEIVNFTCQKDVKKCYSNENENANNNVTYQDYNFIKKDLQLLCSNLVEYRQVDQSSIMLSLDNNEFIRLKILNMQFVVTTIDCNMTESSSDFFKYKLSYIIGMQINNFLLIKGYESRVEQICMIILPRYDIKSWRDVLLSKDFMGFVQPKILSDNKNVIIDFEKMIKSFARIDSGLIVKTKSQENLLNMLYYNAIIDSSSSLFITDFSTTKMALGLNSQ
jgi:hypothetical protein